ncbi:hypothetical protein VPH35_016243 [Triticum aestivum]|nr:F-box protein At5g03100-like [Aegilops tauschii subsp. strangulata]
MEPTGRSTKRMRPAPPDIHQSTPGPAETTDPEATAPGRTQHPPPGAGRDGGEGSPDRISDLPDAVLGEIIFLLPTKEGARTQALASRWRHLWRAAPLNLDCRGIPGNLPGAILSAHGGPVHRLCLPSLLLQYRADVAGTWLRSPSLDKLQELEFYLELPITYRFSFLKVTAAATTTGVHLQVLVHSPRCHHQPVPSPGQYCGDASVSPPQEACARGGQNL